LREKKKDPGGKSGGSGLSSIVTVHTYAIQMDVNINLDVRTDVIIMADPVFDMEIIFNNLIRMLLNIIKSVAKAEITIDSSDSEAILNYFGYRDWHNKK